MKQEILKLLRYTDGKTGNTGFVSGQELCNHFHVSRTAVWKAINQLREEGYKIESVTNRGYRLMEAPDVISAGEIKAAQDLFYPGTKHTEEIGTEIFCFETVDSTNTRAVQLFESGAQAGLLVVSNEQTAGKGRRGRAWNSGSDKGIYMSLLLKPRISPNHASMITLVAALAVRSAIEKTVSGKNSGVEEPVSLIKWPNDIVINGRKVCGILTEMNTQIDYINHLVIGIGINVHNESFPEEISGTAGSIFSETGTRIRRAELIARFLYEFARYYQVFLETEDLQGLLAEYNKYLVNCDREVRVLDPQKEYTGTARGINQSGELLVEVPGRENFVCVSSGEVSVRGIYGYV